MIVIAYCTYLIIHIVDALNLMSIVCVCVCWKEMPLCDSYSKKSIDIQENNGKHNMNVSGVNEWEGGPTSEEGEADLFFQNLLPGGEIEYQQWYHMPDASRH
jgi:hypothetical protein